MKCTLLGSILLVLTLVVSTQAVNLKYEISGARNFVLNSDTRLDDWGDAWTIGGGIALGDLHPVQPVITVSYTKSDGKGARLFDNKEGETYVDGRSGGIIAPACTVYKDKPPLISDMVISHYDFERGDMLQLEASMRISIPLTRDGFHLILPIVGMNRMTIHQQAYYSYFDGNVYSSGSFMVDETSTSWYTGAGIGLSERIGDHVSFILEQRILWSYDNDMNITFMPVRFVIQIH